MQRAKGTTSKHHLSLDSDCDQRCWEKERDSLTMEFHFGIGAQHTTETKEHTDDEKECPRFSEKEGGWARGKKIKGYVLTVIACSRQSPASHSGSLLLSYFCQLRFSHDTYHIRVGVIFFKILKAAKFCSLLNSHSLNKPAILKVGQ